MSDALAQACLVLFWLAAPSLLAIRFFRPRILPRWAVLIAAAVLGGAALYLLELLRMADMMETVQRFGVLAPPVPPVGDGMVSLRGPYASDFILGASLQLAYLLLWLVPYGIIRILLNRQRQSQQVSG